MASEHLVCLGYFLRKENKNSHNFIEGFVGLYIFYRAQLVLFLFGGILGPKGIKKLLVYMGLDFKHTKRWRLFFLYSSSSLALLSIVGYYY